MFGELLITQGRKEEALEALSTALRLRPMPDGERTRIEKLTIELQSQRWQPGQ